MYIKDFQLSTSTVLQSDHMCGSINIDHLISGYEQVLDVKIICALLIGVNWSSGPDTLNVGSNKKIWTLLSWSCGRIEKLASFKGKH